MRFIFKDSRGKRWNKLTRKARLAIFLLDAILILLLWAVFYVPSLSDSQKIPVKKTADQITVQNPGEIRISGIGDDTRLVEVGGRPELHRYLSLGNRRIVLTFDDGPDPEFTPKILDLLKEKQVRAVFFVVGERAFRHPDLLKRITDEGHVLGVHTLTHIEDMPEEERLSRAGIELDFPQKIIIANTGYKTKLFRAPFWGAEDTISEDNLLLVLQAMDRGYSVVSNTLDSHDWREDDISRIVDNSFDPSSSQIILMHDAGGDRSKTLASLPQIIDAYRGAGYEFDVLQASMVRVGILERVIASIPVGIYWVIVNFWLVLSAIFKVALIILATDIFLNLSLAFVHVLQKKKAKGNYKGLVSILVPAYNEENTIAKTLESLKNLTYSNFEIIVIDNNSTDETSIRVKPYLKRNKVKLLHEKRQGKFHALNRGIKFAKGEVVVVLDADTQALPASITNLVKPFSNSQIGATAGNLRVGNITNLLTAFQSVEYILGLNLERRAYEVAGAILVVPGALGAWRKSVVKQAGGFKGDTLTEDADLTIRVQKAGYKIQYVESAIAYTEAPEKLQPFIKQRLRWNFGILQVLFKHRRLLFNPKYGRLSMLILPFVSLVRLPMMVMAPLVDILAVVYLWFNPIAAITYFLIFIGITTFLAAVAFILGREKRIWLLATLPFSRFSYQFLGYYILYRSILAILKGAHLPWNKLSHFGTVKLSKSPYPILARL